jgi:hypothetical protein
MSVTLGDKRLPTAQAKTLLLGSQTGHLSTDDEERCGRPTQVTIPENMDAIHSTILDDRRICVKKDSRGPGDIPRKSRPYYSRDFRHEKTLSQMDYQLSQC